MRIAVLGATSLIARDLVSRLSLLGRDDLFLFARRPQAVINWLASVGLSERHPVADYGGFSASMSFDVILNFVGVGNPARLAKMDVSVFDVSRQYDEMALDYLQQHPGCRYVFLSSGAAYGATYEDPVTEDTKATCPVNHFQTQDWYGIAKLHAELRHRALINSPIIDIRVFSYASRYMDLSSRYLLADALRSIFENTVLTTSPASIQRDFIHPDDLFELVNAALISDERNTAVDCYSKRPAEKFELLNALSQRFGLRYETLESKSYLIATGMKPQYFSLNRRASAFGYAPKWGSVEGVLDEAGHLLHDLNWRRAEK